MFIEVALSKKARVKRSLIYGVGVTDVWYKTEYIDAFKHRHVCPFYKKWVAMHKRCYSQSYLRDNPTYDKVKVCCSWHCFSVFRAWMVQQDWVGKELDKDILGDGTLYSPETCALVSHATNCLFLGAEVTGVTWCKTRKRYLAQCSREGKNKVIGRYKTIKEAKEAYCVYKAAIILGQALKESDNRVKEKLTELATIFV